MKHLSNALNDVLPMALLLALLAGCSGTTTEAARPGPSSSAEVSASPTAAGSPPASLPRTVEDRRAEDLPAAPDTTAMTAFTGPASDRFGADKVMQAYLSMTQLLLRGTFDDEAVVSDTPVQRVADMVRKSMTPQAQERWDLALRDVRAMNGNEQSFEDAFALASWGLLQTTREHVPGAEPREPRVRDSGFGGGTTALDGETLIMRFPIKGQVLTAAPDGQPYRLEVRKDVDLSLVLDAGGRWLIDAYSVRRVIEKPVLDAAS